MGHVHIDQRLRLRLEMGCEIERGERAVGMTDQRELSPAESIATALMSSA